MSEKEKILRKEREKKINDIVQIYKLWKIKLVNKRALSKFKIRKYEAFIDKVDECLSKLGYPYSLIFKNCYFEDRYCWWNCHYSTAHYYRLRNASAIMFLDYFEHYDETL